MRFKARKPESQKHDDDPQKEQSVGATADEKDDSTEKGSALNSQAEESEAEVESSDIDDEVDKTGPASDVLQQAIAERDEAREQYLRAIAEFRNFQRRSVQNEQAAGERARVDLIRELLPVLDSFDLALAHGQECETADSGKESAAANPDQQLFKGVQMVRDLLHQTLSNRGLRSIEPAPGDEFDPTFHEAVMTQRSDEIEPGCIVQAMQVGYALNDAVLRPAKVMIAQAAQHNEEDS